MAALTPEVFCHGDLYGSVILRVSIACLQIGRDQFQMYGSFEPAVNSREAVNVTCGSQLMSLLLSILLQYRRNLGHNG